MKLLVVAAIIGVCSAARLEHLERGYLPPDHGANNGNGNGNAGQGFGSFGAGAGAGARSSGAAGFQSRSNFNAASLKQYLPPDHGPSSGNGLESSFGGASSGSNFGSGAQSGFSQFSQQQFGQEQAPNSQYGAQQANQYGRASSALKQQQFGLNQRSQFGADAQEESQNGSDGGSFGANGGSFGAKSGSFGANGGFGSQNGFSRQQSSVKIGSSQNGLGAAGRQYLAPKTTNNFQNIPQQAFDEETGYHY